METAYRMARNNGDFVAATHFAYQILAHDTMNVDWKDTLAGLYYQRNAWLQTETFAAAVLNSRPNDTLNLYRVAQARQNLGKNDLALADYTRYYEMRPSTSILYQIAVLHFMSNQKQKAFETAQRILQDANSQREGVVINFEQPAGTPRVQMVPTRSAALNLAGVILLEAEQKDQAKIAFQNALQSYPEFVLAYNNLRTIDQNLADGIVREYIQQQQAAQRQQQSLGGGAPQGMPPAPGGGIPGGR
jgi:tetratricopeptide (TPR) repeat protein